MRFQQLRSRGSVSQAEHRRLSLPAADPSVPSEVQLLYLRSIAAEASCTKSLSSREDGNSPKIRTGSFQKEKDPANYGNALYGSNTSGLNKAEGYLVYNRLNTYSKRESDLLTTNSYKMYRRGSDNENTDIPKPRKSSSSLSAYDNTDMDEAFAGYRDRERRRKSSVWRVNPEKIEPTNTKQNAIIIAVMIVTALIIVVALSMYVRNSVLDDDDDDKD